MAQRVLVELVDDLDGLSSDSVSTVKFGLDGVEYEIDLGSDNAERIRDVLEPYVAAGRRTGGRLKRGARSNGQRANPGEAGQIRTWAQENGYDLAARGRIPREVIDAYQDAKEAGAKKTKARSSGRRSKRS